jgi:hypothetical protein
VSECTEIIEICGDYAFDVKYSEDNQFTMFFNSCRNAKTVKRCIEADNSVPNVATAVDFVEVVRCRNCKNLESCTMKVRKLSSVSKDRIYFETDLDHFCSYGVRKEE